MIVRLTSFVNGFADIWRWGDLLGDFTPLFVYINLSWLSTFSRPADRDDWSKYYVIWLSVASRTTIMRVCIAESVMIIYCSIRQGDELCDFSRISMSVDA